MKRSLFCLIVSLCLVTKTFSQAKKPTIMVVPSDAWCIEHGFFKEIDNQGEKEKIPDYKKAVQESTDLLSVIAKINDLMTERGFPLKNLESALKTLSSENAENNMLSSKNGGGLSESPVDKLKKVAKADIIIQLTWKVNQIGPKKSVTFILQGLDSYTDKQVAGASGTGNELIGATLSDMLGTAVLSHIDNFNVLLQKHFDDMFANGREIIVRVKKFDNWDGDLEKKFDGKELSASIEDWMKANTVAGKFNTSEATENMMLFEQVRIPLFDQNGKALDARGFGKSLQAFLEAPPFGITNKLMTKGLGQFVIVLGDK